MEDNGFKHDLEGFSKARRLVYWYIWYLCWSIIIAVALAVVACVVLMLTPTEIGETLRHFVGCLILVPLVFLAFCI